jgi:lysophospholipase L1-like esterase
VSVQVSYKKQTLLALLLILILFFVVEGVANMWWVFQIECEFEENEIFTTMDNSKKRQLCIDLYDIKTSGSQLIPNQNNDSIKINSEGFRGDNFSIVKPDGFYRIIMTGGSTMFGYGATSTETTIPGYFEALLQNDSKLYNVEVINAGIQGATSSTELELIKNKLIDYEPDLIIVYDGWNDLRSNYSSEYVLKNWNEMCQLSQENDFELMIFLQPIAGFGDKVLTEQEFDYAQNGQNYDGFPLIESFQLYNEYAENLTTSKNCNFEIDLRSAFDNSSGPIYWDQGHVSDEGNGIIAQLLLEILLPVIPSNLSTNTSQIIVQNISEPNIEDITRSIISNYKTPIMVTSIFSFELLPQDEILEKKSTQKLEKLSFETESVFFKNKEIIVKVDLSNIENEIPNNKIIELSTWDKSSNSSMKNVTYFLTITKNDKIILNDFFYVQDEYLSLKIIYDDSDEMDIIGERQYDHNAIIVNKNFPISVIGNMFDSNGIYEISIDLRTIDDPTEWIFSLDDFNVKIPISDILLP